MVYLFEQFLEMYFNFGHDPIPQIPIFKEEQGGISKYEYLCQNSPGPFL
jgi:hypothetical protein